MQGCCWISLPIGGSYSAKTKVVEAIAEDGFSLMCLGTRSQHKEHWGKIGKIAGNLSSLGLLEISFGWNICVEKRVQHDSQLRLKERLIHDREGGIRQLEAIQEQILYNFGQVRPWSASNVSWEFLGLWHVISVCCGYGVIALQLFNHLFAKNWANCCVYALLSKKSCLLLLLWIIIYLSCKRIHLFYIFMSLLMLICKAAFDSVTAGGAQRDRGIPQWHGPFLWFQRGRLHRLPQLPWNLWSLSLARLTT